MGVLLVLELGLDFIVQSGYHGDFAARLWILVDAAHSLVVICVVWAATRQLRGLLEKLQAQTVSMQRLAEQRDQSEANFRRISENITDVFYQSGR